MAGGCLFQLAAVLRVARVVEGWGWRVATGWRRERHSSPRRHSNRALTDNGRDSGLRDSDNDSDNRSRVQCSVGMLLPERSVCVQW